VRTIDVQVLAPASPAAVWRLLSDVSTWTSWGPWQAAELTSRGSDGLEGVGAVRTLRYRGMTSVEQVVEVQPEKRLGYTLRRGLPLRNYRADVRLVPVGRDTAIRWTSQFDGPFAWFFAPGLARFIRRVAGDLARAAAGNPPLPTGSGEHSTAA
jgi:uncharacterized protein YndB with AHSA1/START domain